MGKGMAPKASNTRKRKNYLICTHQWKLMNVWLYGYLCAKVTENLIMRLYYSFG